MSLLQLSCKFPERGEHRIPGEWQGNESNDNGDSFDSLLQERRNSSALAMELRLYYTNPTIYSVCQK